MSLWLVRARTIIHKEVKKKIKKEQEKVEKELDDYWGGVSEKEKCPNCGKLVKKLDEENGVCKSCLKYYDG